jgi:hypothetical protein
MANLAEVKTALKQGDRQKASQLLKSVLQDRPTADAWYMAAQMAGSKETAMKHLQRALTLDSRHTKSRDMLRELGGEQKGIHHNLLEEVQVGMGEFGQNSRFLSRLEPKQRAIIASALFGFIGIAIVTLLVNLVRQPPPTPTPEFIPAPTAVILASDVVRSHFTGSGLVIADIEVLAPPTDTPVSEQVVLTVQDTVGPHEVTIYMYPSIDGLVNDRLRLAEFDAANNIVVNQNAVLIYPTSVETAVASSLETVFNSVPLTPPTQ